MDVDHYKDRCDLGEYCPLRAVHARLLEAHRHWHHAANGYSDPDGFRTYLNACIQALRNVTFVLQKQKSSLPRFEDWYTRWQEYLKSDPILRWVVTARNQIVKQGDLETKSVARVALVSSYLDPPHVEYEVKPSTPTPIILDFLMANKPEDLPDRLLDTGFLKVERRWVVEDLPDHELLDALAHAFGVLRSLVRDAHRLLASKRNGGSTDAPSPADLDHEPPGCMVASHEQRTACVNARTGQPLEVLRTPASFIPPEAVEAVRAHYGEIDFSSLTKRTGSKLRDWAGFLFGIGKQVIERDGYHHPVVFLLTKETIYPCSLEFEDRREKYIVWRSVAADVERLGATAVFAISEVWGAPFDPQHPMRHAVDAPDRSEGLSLAAASEDGEVISISCRFDRVDGKIVLGEQGTFTDGSIGMFFPIYEVWSRRKRQRRQDRPGESIVDAPTRKHKRRKRRSR